jgi:hypothetical protein
MKGMQVVYENRPYMHLDPASTTALEIFPTVADPTPSPVEIALEQPTISIPVLEVDTTEPLSLISPDPGSLISQDPLPLEQQNGEEPHVTNEELVVELIALEVNGASEPASVAQLPIIEAEPLQSEPQSDLGSYEVVEPASMEEEAVGSERVPPHFPLLQSEQFPEVNSEEPEPMSQHPIVEVDAPITEVELEPLPQPEEKKEAPVMEEEEAVIVVEENVGADEEEAPVVEEVKEAPEPLARPMSQLPIVEESQPQPTPAVEPPILQCEPALAPEHESRRDIGLKTEPVPVPTPVAPTPPEPVQPIKASSPAPPRLEPSRSAPSPKKTKSEPTKPVEMQPTSPPPSASKGHGGSATNSKVSSTVMIKASSSSLSSPFSTYAMFATGFALVVGGAFLFLRRR